MNALRLLVSISVLQCGAIAQQSPSDEIAAAAGKFKEAFSRQQALEAKALGPVKAAYLQELRRLRDTAKAKGQLDGVIEAEAALKAAEEGTSAPAPKVLAAALSQARTTYEKASENALKIHASGRAKLRDELDRAMTALEQKFTRAGNIDAAKQAREAKKSVELSAPEAGPETKFVGTWLAENETAGNKDKKSINADGTFGKDGATIGKWEVKDQKLIFHYPSGGSDVYDLPIRNNKLVGKNNLGQTVSLTRQR